MQGIRCISRKCITCKLVVALETLLKFNMASRFYKIGSIFSRVNGFMRKGFVKYEERPIWYDIYAQFPPKYEPRFSRPALDVEIQEIFYSEDLIRAKAHKKFSHKLGVYNLFDETEKTNSQRWIESYNEFIAQGMSESEALKQLEDLIERPVQDFILDHSVFNEEDLSSPHAKTMPKLKIFNSNFDEDVNINAHLSTKTTLKSDLMDENLSEDINVDETVEVSSPVIPMAKTISKSDEKNKDSE